MQCTLWQSQNFFQLVNILFSFYLPTFILLSLLSINFYTLCHLGIQFYVPQFAVVVIYFH